MNRLLLLIILQFFAGGCFAQRAIGDIFPYTTDPDYRLLVTLVDGNFIRGVVFLDMEWRKGSVTLKNGNVYPDYKLKYDSYHQTLLFLNGKDSLEATDPIKEFTIYDKNNAAHRFVNADEYKPQSKPLFYEVLLNGEKGQLLKVHRTLVRASSELSNAAAERQLYQSYQYFWYDKSANKIRELMFSKGSVEAALKLTETDENKISFDSYRFNDEGDLFNFFKAYLQ